MKNYIAILMAIACAAALLLTGCGQNNDPQPDPQPSGLTGSVASDGSTSMQKVINTLGEAKFTPYQLIAVLIHIRQRCSCQIADF